MVHRYLRTVSILCFFCINVFAKTEFPNTFFFGVANAPGQVEDQLSDIWMDWADQKKISAFQNQTNPKEKLSFWTKPEVEIELAASTGITSYRMGVDWGRIMPRPGDFDQKAIEHYKKIIHQVKSKKMKIMLTLMHHSIPKWAQDMGGWKNDKMIDYFLIFAQKIIREFHSDVEWWATFNEGNVFVTMAYTAGIWPPGEKSSVLSMFSFGPFAGESVKAMDRMAAAHNSIYDWAHKNFPIIKIGIAHNMAYYTSKGWIERWIASYADETMNWRFPEKIKNKMDFFGFNYYGAEWLKKSQVDIDPDEEYSEAGRAIHPEGLYWLLTNIHSRYPKLPIIITENGVADETDILRPSYLIEHLMVVHRAISEGIPIQGYFLWSMTDNLEWSDGYCPKFGLVAVDREKNLKRIPRKSFQLFKKIVETKIITKEMRENAWQDIVRNQGKSRPFCRAPDGITAYDKPVERKIVIKDWRFRPSSD
jgi:beta-glucosidase/6-phospho-beta-glucosidase/beta-galactosidase